MQPHPSKPWGEPRYALLVTRDNRVAFVCQVQSDADAPGLERKLEATCHGIFEHEYMALDKREAYWKALREECAA